MNIPSPREVLWQANSRKAPTSRKNKTIPFSFLPRLRLVTMAVPSWEISVKLRLTKSLQHARLSSMSEMVRTTPTTGALVPRPATRINSSPTCGHRRTTYFTKILKYTILGMTWKPIMENGHSATTAANMTTLVSLTIAANLVPFYINGSQTDVLCIMCQVAPVWKSGMAPIALFWVLTRPKRQRIAVRPLSPPRVFMKMA